MKLDTAIAIIPARYSSTRFPGKPIVEIHGKPLIEHVYRQVAAGSFVNHIIVATDDGVLPTPWKGLAGMPS